MKNLYRKLIVASLLLATMFVTGCASGPKYRDYIASVPGVKPGEGRIWFYRPGYGGALVQPSVVVNNQKVGTAQPAGFFYIDRPPGHYEVKCTTEWTHRCDFMLAAQQNKYVRLNLWFGLFCGHIVPREVSEPEALGQLQNQHLNN